MFSPDRRAVIAGATAALAAIPSARANPTDFRTWLAELRSEAARQGISQRTIDGALAGVAPIPRVLELDRRQPESTMTFAQYRDRVINNDRVEQGRQRLVQNRDLLARVTERYGVPARFIMALWGMETSYGANMGGFKIVDALATLAYDGRRSQFFRTELLAALRILDQGHIAPERMLGSWAGAMGQSQFMPSSFLQYAVDFDGDGRRDIWTSQPDVFASAANYLARNGWVRASTCVAPSRPGRGWASARPAAEPSPAGRPRRRWCSRTDRAGIRSSPSRTSASSCGGTGRSISRHRWASCPTALAAQAEIVYVASQQCGVPARCGADVYEG